MVYKSAIFTGTGMSDPQMIFFRIAMGFVIGPIVAIVLFGLARLGAMALVKWMPESWLKRRLLTDTETGRLAYKPASTGRGLSK
jgi:hypothetical protein